MGLHGLTPLSFEYLFHLLGAIVSASQAENYDACNSWIKEINLVLTSSQVVVSVSCKQQLMKAMMQISHSEKIKDFEEMVNLLANIKTMPDPVS